MNFPTTFRVACVLPILGLFAAPTAAQTPAQFSRLGKHMLTPLGHFFGHGRLTIVQSLAHFADLDGDRDLDLVVIGIDGNRIALNDGQGGFTPGVPLTRLRYETFAGAVGDVDGDGDVDLVFATADDLYGGVQNQLYLNDGTGRFTEASSRLPQVQDCSYAVALGDVDGDRDLDIFFGNDSRSNGDKLYLNDGRGNFTDASSQLPANIAWPTQATFGDADGDGDLDLVVATSGQDRLLRNDGRGTFTDATAGLPQRAEFSTGMVFVDLDGDRDLDLTFASGNGQNRLYLNDGRGAFADATASLPVANDVSRGVAAQDMDGDGDTDLVFGNAGHNRLYLNDGSGRFTIAGTAKVPPFGGGLVALGDVDGDGDADAFFTADPAFPRLYLNDGTGKLQPADMPRPAWGGDALATADIDGDGDLDYVTAGSRQGGQAALNDGRGVFHAGPTFPVPAGGLIQELALRDLDADGDPDCVIASFGSPLRLLLNDGSGKFTDATATHLPGSATRFHPAFEIADVDGDGDPDIVAAMGQFPANGGVVDLYRNDGRGRFTRVSGSQMPSIIGVAEDVTIGDVDGDGDPDIVVAYPDASTPVRIFLNDGNGTFTDAGARLPMGARGVALGDVDRDGDLDMALTECSAVVRLLLNDGRGGFANVTATHMPPRILGGGTLCSFVNGLLAPEFADIDEDGDLDLMIEGLGAGLHALYANNGRGQFTDESARQQGETHLGRDFALGDVDGDGDLDLFSSAVGNTDSVLFNLRYHIHAPRMAVIGRSFELRVYARHNQLANDYAVPFVSTQAAHIPVPSLGILGIDPNSMIGLRGVNIPRSGDAAVTFMVPSDPALVGVTFYLQALIGTVSGTPRLSNVLVETVLR